MYTAFSIKKSRKKNASVQNLGDLAKKNNLRDCKNITEQNIGEQKEKKTGNKHNAKLQRKPPHSYKCFVIKIVHNF